MRDVSCMRLDAVRVLAQPDVATVERGVPEAVEWELFNLVHRHANSNRAIFYTTLSFVCPNLCPHAAVCSCRAASLWLTDHLCPDTDSDWVYCQPFSSRSSFQVVLNDVSRQQSSHAQCTGLVPKPLAFLISDCYLIHLGPISVPWGKNSLDFCTN